MKKKALLIGGIAATALLAGGWAMAQTSDQGPGGFGPGGMQGMGPGMHSRMGQGMHGQMGPGMHGQMGQGMHGQMGPDMRGQMGQSMHGQMGPGMHGGSGLTQFDPTRIDALKTELGITAAQEPAWSKYSKALQDAANTMKTAREGVDREAVSKMSPQDRFAFVTKAREQGQKQFETVKAAANELLATLNDTQKAKAQETLPGLAFGPGMMRGAAMGGPAYRQ